MANVNTLKCSLGSKESCDACGKWAMLLSAANNVGLALLKGIVGFVTGSKALLADALHSGADIICALFGIVSAWMSGKDIDSKHPYGYGKIEFIVGIVVGVVLSLAAINILFSSLKLLLFTPMTNIHAPQQLAFWVALLSIYANVVVSRVTLCAAKRLNSPALNAISSDNRSDAYSSIPVAIALLGAQLGIPQLDPIGAVFVGLLIGKIAYGLIKQNYLGLMDASIPPQDVRAIARIINNIPQVKSIGYLKTRLTGKSIWVDTQVLIDGKKSVSEADKICIAIRNAVIKGAENIGDVQVTLKSV